MTEFREGRGTIGADGPEIRNGPRRPVAAAIAVAGVAASVLVLADPGVSERLHQADIAATRATAEAAPAMPAVVRASELVAHNPLFKGIVVMTVFWGLWFSVGTDRQRQARLVAVLMLSVVAIITGRALALLLPFRLRPRFSDEFASLFGSAEQSMAGWSAMPSDHAVLFFALAVGIGLVSRLFGVLLLAHALFIVCLPRIFLGLHHVGDILVGALVGAGVAVLTLPSLVRTLETVDLPGFIERRPGWFYAGAIWITTQFALMFDPVREFARALLG